MIATVSGRKVYYEVKGQGEPMVLLHGWGGSVQSFRAVINRLSLKNRVYAFDLPGFGKSDPPGPEWGSGEYTETVVEVLDQLKISRPHVIGHSFGGKIAMRMAAFHPDRINKLVLVDSAGIPPKRGWKYRLRVGGFKMAKKLLGLLGKWGENRLNGFYRKVGSDDYRQAGALRPVMVRVVNEDVTPIMGKITCPTLLIWGELDTDTPLSDGQFIHDRIAASRLVVIKEAGHYSYLDNPDLFYNAVSNFLGDKP
jgi:pimeloyl-ACP methyl ester carboxylesterase